MPCEDSSANRQRLGHISKQGNTLLRFLLVEAAQAVVRCDPEWRGRFLHLVMGRGRPIAPSANIPHEFLKINQSNGSGTSYIASRKHFLVPSR